MGENAMSTKVLPVLTGLVMAYLFVIIFRDFGALTGAAGWLGVALPALVLVAGAAGYVMASGLAKSEPARFGKMGDSK